MMVSEFNTEHFVFRNYIELSEEESYLIWKGRNHPNVRMWMDNSAEFPFDQHLKYVESLRQKSDRLYFAALYDGRIIGSFCLNPFNSETKEGELGKFLLTEYMGRGLGKMATREFLNYFFEHEIVNQVVIRTKLNNLKNQHVNESVGFHEYKRDETYVYMKMEGV